MSREKSTKKGRRARADAEAKLPDGCRVKARYWIERKGETFLASGRVALLEAIDRCGSISEAAREMGISYRHAWLMADAMNRLGRKELFITSPTGTSLTEEGRRLIALFDRLSARFRRFLSKGAFM